jgi:hypothetical protein
MNPISPVPYYSLSEVFCSLEEDSSPSAIHINFSKLIWCIPSSMPPFSSSAPEFCHSEYVQWSWSMLTNHVFYPCLPTLWLPGGTGVVKLKETVVFLWKAHSPYVAGNWTFSGMHTQHTREKDFSLLTYFKIRPFWYCKLAFIFGWKLIVR